LRDQCQRLLSKSYVQSFNSSHFRFHQRQYVIEALEPLLGQRCLDSLVLGCIELYGH
jgi:hypothetical protein